VTPAEIIYHRRVQVLDRAGQTSVTEACRTFGISRTTSYRWAGRAQRYGLAALLPKGRRPPVMATATPPDQVQTVLAEAVARPTIGARRLVDHLAVRGVRLSAVGGAEAPAAPPARPPRPADCCAGPAHCRDHRHRDRPGQGWAVRVMPLRRPPWRSGRPGHLLGRQAPKASGRSGSSPPWIPPPATPSAPWSPGTNQLVTRPASSTTSLSGWPASAPSSPGC
jgi:transposase